MEAAKGANPFLMMGADDFSDAAPATSNPFLMESSGDFSGASPFSDNPFLSQAADEQDDCPVTSATNPFAFQSYDTPATNTTAENDLFGCNVSSTQPAAHEGVTTTDFFTIESNEPTVAPAKEVPQAAVQKPDMLDLTHTHTVTKVDENVQMYSSDEELAKVPPRRPPPPRPNVPPSKETQDLIMSVTGAMDATSSHLLDRIPPTRTPSPVSMRDLHSPSPTPEHAFADFLDVGAPAKPAAPPQAAEIDFFDMGSADEAKPEPTKPETNPDQLISLMSGNGVCDINQNHSTANKEPPARPPRPQPPQKPPPPMFKGNASPPAAQPQVPPAKPPPPKKPEPDMMDMLGDGPLPVEKPVASTADIMSLYSAAPVVSKPEPVMDLLCETTDTNTTAVQDSLMSPEVSQHELHMDTSDTQSKGSASSAVFNPFAAEEPVVNTIIDTSSPVQSQNNNDDFLQDDTFGTNNANDAFGTNDANDAFGTNDANDAFGTSNANDSFSTKNAKAAFGTNNANDAFGANNANDAFGTSNTNDTFSTKNAKAAFGTNNANDAFGTSNPTTESLLQDDAFGTTNQPAETLLQEQQPSNDVTNDNLFGKQADDFDDFAAKFESAAKDEPKNGFDPFANSGSSAWGNLESEDKGASGFEADEPFDSFLSLQEPPAVPQGTPSMLSKRESQESDEDKDFSVFIKPKNEEMHQGADVVMPTLAPPPKSPVQNAFTDTSPRFNPFDQQTDSVSTAVDQTGAFPIDSGQYKRTDSQETPPTPLFDDDVSQPLEDFPRVNFDGDGWEMQLRQPNKKKITGQRFWKKIFVRLVVQEGCPILQLFNTATDKDAFQELPLQPCYSVSDIGAQQYDTYGKIFTLKLQYIFYKERPGVRPGQVTKAERITNKLSQFAAYAIQGDYQGVKEFGSDLKKLGLPVEHAPQVSQLLKLGSLNYEDMKQFSVCIEEALFRLSAHRDRALHYKMEEVQVTAVDELYVEQDADGRVEKQIARVRLFFLGFLSGMPDVELGVNDMRRQGKEVVGRHDIIPVITEEWIRLEAVEFHSCVQQDEYHNTHIIKFKPPDACYIELMRFRIRPPKNRELPLQLKPVMCITGNKVEIRADVLVPGFASRKLGQVPCEDVMIRIPIPECWIYLFRVEKHFRYGSVKSAHRRTGKIKGIERFLGTVETLQESLIEVTSGQAKYEHQHRAIVWRIPRLPKEGQGAYTTHNLVCRLALTSYDQIPDQLAEYCYVEFTMPATQASHTTVRSVSLQNSQSDDPPEKYVRYLARHEYKVGIEHTEGEDPNPYAAATAISRNPAPVPEEPPAPVVPDPESSSDSD